MATQQKQETEQATKPSLRPSEKSSISVDLDKERMWWYGEPGVGKSTTANFSDTLFIATDPGHSKMECFVVPIGSWAAFLAICTELKTGEHKFKRICIDTIDKLYLMCSAAKCKALNIEHETDLDGGKGWMVVNRAFDTTIQALTALKMGIIFISHEKTEKIKTRTEEYYKHSPSLSPAPAKIIGSYVDHIMRFAIEDDLDSVDKQKRIIQVAKSKYYLSKSRGDKETSIFTNDMAMSYAAIQAEYEDGIKRLLEATKNV